GSGSGIGATLITTDTDGHETASAPVPPADMNETPIEQTERLVDGSGSLMWGTASTLVRTITSVASDGSGTDATLMGWPDGMRATTRVTEQSQLDGSIWFAIVPEIGQLQVNAPDSVSPSSLPLAASALDYHVAGDVVVATGNDLGHEWMLRLQGGALTLSLDGGASLGTFSATEQGDGGLLNVPGGAFLFSIEPRDVGGLRVSSDVSGSVTIASGRWMPAGSDLGRDGRVWVVALPGASTGFVQVEGRSPMAFSWPTSGVPAAGQVLRSGSDDIVSWAMRWSGRGCPSFEVYSDVRGNTGGSDCFIPWDGTDPFVGGFYGRTDAVVVVIGPKDMLCTVDDPTGRVSGGLSGGTIAQVARWAQTGSCILTIPVGDTVTVHLTDVHGGPIIGQRGVIRITAKPRSLTVG
ncbi:MAG TPA: hypothetical protein VI411_07695, partial [Actinomycetota bacterium]